MAQQRARIDDITGMKTVARIEGGVDPHRIGMPAHLPLRSAKCPLIYPPLRIVVPQTPQPWARFLTQAQ